MKLQIQLQAEGAGTAAQQFEVPLAGDAVILGRGPDSPVPLEGSKLSRNHVAFGVSNGQLTLTDLSSNGVWVNAQSVPKKSAIALQGNEEIAIPGYRLRVRLVIPPPEPAPAPAPKPIPQASPQTPQAPAPAPALAENASPPAPAAASTDKSRITSELAATAVSVPALSTSIDDAPPEPAWWHLSSAERLILIFVALAAGLFYYYYSLQ